MAKQERIRLSERTKAGLEKARKEGRVGGRPKVITDRGNVKELRAVGKSLPAIAREQSEKLRVFHAIANIPLNMHAGPGCPANLFQADIPVTINGVPFLVTITAHFMPDQTIYTPYSSIQFWNQQTGATIDVPLAGTISSYAYAINEVGPTIDGSFSGSGYNGRFVLNLLPHHPCKVGRFCYLIYWGQVNSTLTLD